MADSHGYTMLMNLLPAHGQLFGARQPPLSRIRLNQALTLLKSKDADALRALRRLLEWAAQDPQRNDADILRHARQVIAGLSHPFVRDLAEWRLELRTLICALRRRQRDQSPPTTTDWGYGRWRAHLAQHWREPGFQLERAFPWLPEANRLLGQEDALGLERLLLGVVWNHLERLSDGHHFDFEAVVIYTLRWDLVARWSGYDRAGAGARFDTLVAQGLSDADLGMLGRET